MLSPAIPTWTAHDRAAPMERSRLAAGDDPARRCPCCQSSALEALPIRYGMVAPSVLLQARRGEIALGPVNHGRNEPQLQCRRCETRYGARRADLDRFGRPLSPRPIEPPPAPVRLTKAVAVVAAIPAPPPVAELLEVAQLRHAA